MLSIKVFCTRLHLQLWISARSGATLPTQAASNLMWVFPAGPICYFSFIATMAETDNFIPEKFSSSSSPALIWALQRWWEYYLCPVHIKSNHRKKGGCGLWMERRSLKLFYCTAFLYWPALRSSLNWRFILFLSGLMVGWGKFPHCHCIVFYINIYWTSARKIFQMVRTPYLLSAP